MGRLPRLIFGVVVRMDAGSDSRLSLREGIRTVNGKWFASVRKVSELTRFMGTEYDALTMHRLTCPTCHADVVWLGNAHRPFCSLVCRLIDLGVWLDERYRIDETHHSDNVS